MEGIADAGTDFKTGEVGQEEVLAGEFGGGGGLDSGEERGD